MSDSGKIALIDELISRKKKLASENLSWHPKNNSDQNMSIRSAIEIDDEIKGRFSFICNAKIYSGNDIETTFILSYEDIPIERMTFNPRAPHTNQILSEIPKNLRGKVLAAGVPRYYSWKYNKNFGFPPPQRFLNLPAAVLVDASAIKNFGSAVNHFFIQTNIQSVVIEEPPFKQMILL